MFKVSALTHSLTPDQEKGTGAKLSPGSQAALEQGIILVLHAALKAGHPGLVFLLAVQTWRYKRCLLKASLQR